MAPKSVRLPTRHTSMSLRLPFPRHLFLRSMYYHRVAVSNSGTRTGGDGEDRPRRSYVRVRVRVPGWRLPTCTKSDFHRGNKELGARES